MRPAAALLTAALFLVALSPCLRAESKDEPAAQPNPVVFWELASHDADASVSFFERVFGWTFDYDEKSTIHFLNVGKEAPTVDGGVFTLKKAKLPFLTIYILVEDIEAKADLVEKNGGFIVIAPKEIDGGAKICLFNEPSGVTFAMYQPPPKAEEP